MHFKGFVCLCMRKLHAECQIPADAHNWCQIVFSLNVPKVIPKYWTTKTLSQFLGWLVRTLAQYTNTRIRRSPKQAQSSAGRNSNLPCGTRGKIGHQINRCVMFWNGIPYRLFKNWAGPFFLQEADLKVLWWGGWWIAFLKTRVMLSVPTHKTTLKWFRLVLLV